MSEKVHETLASSAYGLFTGLASLLYGTVINPKMGEAAFQVVVALVTAVVVAVAVHYVRKMLKAIDAMMEGSMQVPTWLKALGMVFVGGASEVVVRMITDPATFDITNWKKVVTAAAVAGVVAVAAWFAPSPLRSQTRV